MKFSYKSAEELKGMSVENLTAYKNELKAHEHGEEVAPEEIANHLKSINLVADQIIEKQLEGKASKSEIDAVKSEISKIKENSLNRLEKALEAQGKALAQQQRQVSQKGARTFIEQVKEALSLPENAEKLKALKSGTPIEVDFEIKAPGPITKPTNIVGDDTNVLPMPVEFGLVNTPQFVPFITQLTDTGNTSSSRITWTDEINQEGDAEFVAEGGLKPLIDMEFRPAISDAKKCAGVIKVSEEMLDDVPWMASEINNKLRRRHDIVVEDKILFGDETANPEEFDGITTNASAFVAGGLAGTIENANNFDAIRVAITQIINAGKGEWMPNYVCVNPEDRASMDTTKGTDGQYVLPSFVTAGGLRISNVIVIEKPQIPAGSFLLGDFSASHVRRYKSFRIKVGWENDDFRKNMRTIIGESRLHHFISTNEYNAFVYDTFDNAKTALAPVPAP